MTTTKEQIDFIQFAQECDKRNLRAEQRQPWHWQVLWGKFLVNFYPFAKNGPVIYIDSTSIGVKGEWEDAIKYANELPTIAPVHRKKSGYTRHLKWLFKRGHTCYWCGKHVELTDGSVDHLIPLSKGGLNNRNNYVLAHKKCNNERGSRV